MLFDKHYADQATRYINGEYVPERFSEQDVEGNSEAVLKLVPER